MMSHFNLKSLAFYGIAIGSVVLLFKGVTAYGEANLKAPPKVDGNYRISAPNLPECLQPDALLLNIQQSGIYLNGSLLPADNNTQIVQAASEKPSLTGHISNQQLSLAGLVPWATNCNNPVQPVIASEHPIAVAIQAQVGRESIVGQLTLSSMVVEFTAQREEPAEKLENH